MLEIVAGGAVVEHPMALGPIVVILTRVIYKLHPG
jgi:hypothetical protein